MSEPAEEHLPHYRVRPRFKIETTHSEKEIADRIKSRLLDEDAPCKGRIKHGYATLFIPEEEQHYWSPQLTLTLEPTENGSVLRGLYGPPSGSLDQVCFFYTLIGFAILLVSIFGLSYLTLGKSAGILWLVPILIVVFLTLYLVAYFGQKMGHDQMVILHQFVEDSTGLTITDE